ncbi:MAG: glycosyltransferase [Geobacteraceae bacterium]|nr:glycosyltransferase [Geobacteraceae bacterium]
MKIWHLNTFDTIGGAARAAYRIHRAQVESGIDCQMRVVHRGTSDMRVIEGVPLQPLYKLFYYNMERRVIARNEKDWQTENLGLYSFGHFGAGLVDELNNCDADILNLHWIINMLSVSDIGRLKKPLVWTCHDMWPFCGGEHYVPDETAARFRQGYHNHNIPPGERGPDLNRKTWEAKRRAWARQRFTIVSPSHWMAACVKQSVLFAGVPVSVIPNPLDTDNTWRPIPRQASRTALGLPQDKKLILMGAAGGLEDPRKGGDLLHEAICSVFSRCSDGVELVIYGQEKTLQSGIWPCPVHWLGRVNDDRVLALAYSAADVMVVPSRQESFGQTASEAQACGVPVVAFDVGGLPDIVIHRETGWLSKAFDTEDMATGILWVLGDEDRWLELSHNSRRTAVKRFSPGVVAELYGKVYEQVVRNQNIVNH